MSARTMKSSILRSSQNIVMIAMHCRCLDHLCAERPSALSRARSAAQPRSCEAADALSCEDIPLAAPADRLAMRGDRGVSGASSRNKRSSVGVVSYVERLVASSLVACTWEQRTTIGQQQLIVPDACVDLIWAGDRLSIAGPDTQPRVVTLAPGERLVGARLRPGTAGGALRGPAPRRDARSGRAACRGAAAAGHGRRGLGGAGVGAGGHAERRHQGETAHAAY